MWNRQRTRWNIFARELEDMLAVRQFPLTYIDDRTPIHREKVRRLVKSLEAPKSFPVLNSEEIDMVADAFELSEHEILRLRAAILTTAIEAMLMDRIDRRDALAVAEQLLPMIFTAMRKGAGALGAVRGGALLHMDEAMDEMDIDTILERALELIDHATMALHLCCNVDAHTERTRLARQALEYFEAALAELEEAEPEVQAKEAWQVWQQEAQKGMALANEYLEE